MTAYVFLGNHLLKPVKEWNKSKNKPTNELKKLNVLLMVGVFTALKWISLVKPWKYLEYIPVFIDNLFWLRNAWNFQLIFVYWQYVYL